MKVKNYKGIDIYITPNGEFYADFYGNSGEYHRRTINSKKMSSIEKAIDDFGSEKIDKIYYQPDTFQVKIKEIRVIGKIGSVLILNDGTKTAHGFTALDESSPIEIINKMEELEKEFDEKKQQIQSLIKESDLIRAKFIELNKKNKFITIKAANI